MLLDWASDAMAGMLATSPVVASAMASIALSSALNLLSGAVSRVFVPVCPQRAPDSSVTVCSDTPRCHCRTSTAGFVHQASCCGAERAIILFCCRTQHVSGTQNAGVSRGVVGALLAVLGLEALLGGIPEGQLALGHSDYLRRVNAFALGHLLLSLPPRSHAQGSLCLRRATR